MSRFQHTLDRYGTKLNRTQVRVLQVNMGKVCNQVCRHCHVDAGPHRRESMDRATVDEVLAAAERCGIGILDITGGAPELNPHFEHLVSEGVRLACRVIDRCNLTILFVRGKEHLAHFLADNRVEVTASLPCYLAHNVDEQRGKGVFDTSLRALRLLNSLGYGRPGTGLVLNLVYNPLGPVLPPDQLSLETEYRRELAARYEIEFNRLFTLTNLPISRFASQLARAGQFDAYLELLVSAFNPAAVEGLMCRDTLSVGWDGRLYDCDFNQMLDLPLSAPFRHIRELQSEHLTGQTISLGDHCFGCTAGNGSSCGGAIVD